MNAPRLNLSQTGRYLNSTGYIPRWFTCLQAVTHPSTNPAQRRATSLIEHNALAQSRATNKQQTKSTKLDQLSLPPKKNKQEVTRISSKKHTY